MNNEKADVRLEDVEGTKAELDKKEIGRAHV